MAGRLYTGGRTQIVSFHMPKELLQMVDELVEMGVFNNRSELIRTAIHKLLMEYRGAILANRMRMVVGYR